MFIADDKRDHIRMAVQSPGELRLPGESDYRQCLVKDLSASGMLILCDQPLAEGSHFEVRIEPSQAITPPLEAEVEVTRLTHLDGSQYQLACRIVQIR